MSVEQKLEYEINAHRTDNAHTTKKITELRGIVENLGREIRSLREQNKQLRAQNSLILAAAGRRLEKGKGEK